MKTILRKEGQSNRRGKQDPEMMVCGTALPWQDGSWKAAMRKADAGPFLKLLYWGILFCYSIYFYLINRLVHLILPAFSGISSYYQSLLQINHQTWDFCSHRWLKICLPMDLLDLLLKEQSSLSWSKHRFTSQLCRIPGYGIWASLLITLCALRHSSQMGIIIILRKLKLKKKTRKESAVQRHMLIHGSRLQIVSRRQLSPCTLTTEPMLWGYNSAIPTRKAHSQLEKALELHQRPRPWSGTTIITNIWYPKSETNKWCKQNWKPGLSCS